MTKRMVEVAVLDDREGARFFGVPLAGEACNQSGCGSSTRQRNLAGCSLASLDPNYYPPWRPRLSIISAWGRASRVQPAGLFVLAVSDSFALQDLRRLVVEPRMNAFFQEHGINSGLILPGHELAGFVFTTHDAGRNMSPSPSQGRRE